MMLAIWKRGECLRAVAESVAVTCLMYCEKYRRIVKKKVGDSVTIDCRFIFFPWMKIGRLGRGRSSFRGWSL